MRTAARVAAVVAAVLALSARAPQAWACSCVGGLSEADRFRAAAAVFDGVVIGRDEPARDETAEAIWPVIDWTFDVRTVFKGEDPAVAVVSSPAGSGSCAVELEEGKSYRIYAAGTDDGGLLTTLCSGTREIDLAAAPAAAAEEDDDVGTAGAVGGLLIVALGVGFAFGRRRRR